MIYKYSKVERCGWTTVILLRGRETQIISVHTDDFVAAVKQVSKPRPVPFRRRLDTRKVKVIAVCQGTHEKFFEKELWTGKAKLRNVQVSKNRGAQGVASE